MVALWKEGVSELLTIDQSSFFKYTKPLEKVQLTV